MERGVLAERKMCTHLIVVGRIICQQFAQVRFPEHHDMVEAFASDLSDQPFSMTILPGECGAIGRSRMPIARSRRVTSTAAMCAV